MQIVVSNSELDAAWAAFDRARLRLEALYKDASTTVETHALHLERCDTAIEVARRWSDWRDLFLTLDSSSDLTLAD